MKSLTKVVINTKYVFQKKGCSCQCIGKKHVKNYVSHSKIDIHLCEDCDLTMFSAIIANILIEFYCNSSAIYVYVTPHMQMDLICKWVPKLDSLQMRTKFTTNHLQMDLICKWITIYLQMSTCLQMRSKLICKWVQMSHELICKWDLTHLQMRIDSFANESWVICKQGFICIWVSTHLQMSHLSFANDKIKTANKSACRSYT